MYTFSFAQEFYQKEVRMLRTGNKSWVVLIDQLQLH